MNLLQSLTSGLATKEVSAFVSCWLVPLFLLFHIAGWIGLPQREANRSNPRATDQELADLGRAIWGAWLIGIVMALVGISAINGIFSSMLTETSVPNAGVISAGIAGLLLGFVRVLLPRYKPFRDLAPIIRRRILSALVICAVAISATCGALYFESAMMLRSLIASAYTCLFIGYAVSHVLEVGR